MSSRRLLLLSNSKNYGEGYLAHAEAAIKSFLGKQIKKILFIPFAGVRMSFDDYASGVRDRLQQMGYDLESIHVAGDPKDAVGRAEAIVVGGGNTFHLLRELYERDLIEIIRARVSDGLPYIGWSAGSNVACPTISTTNDMPIVQPRSFRAFDLVPFQINPHYTDFHTPQHQGETREERLLEYIEANPGVYVVGLREGSILKIEGSKIELLGNKQTRIFLKGKEAVEYSPDQSLQFLLENRSG